MEKACTAGDRWVWIAAAAGISVSVQQVLTISLGSHPHATMASPFPVRWSLSLAGMSPRPQTRLASTRCKCRGLLILYN